MPIPTENVGSLPRPAKLQAAIAEYDAGKITHAELTREQDAACRDSIERMEATGSPIVSDGEQRASSFATYPLTDTLGGTGLAPNLAADGQYFAIFTDGHHRQLPRLTGGPFKYKTFASEYVKEAMKMATKPLKQAVIAPSMLSLLYPLDGKVDGYSASNFWKTCATSARRTSGNVSTPERSASRLISPKAGSPAGTIQKIHGPDATCSNISSS